MEYYPHTQTWRHFGKIPNAELLAQLMCLRPHLLVCEDMQAMGRAVGAEVFKTVRFTGRVEQICFNEGIPFRLIKRTFIKSKLCPTIRWSKDKHVRAALLTLFGPQGTKSQPGRTYGIANDVWSALAIANVYSRFVLPTESLL